MPRERTYKDNYQWVQIRRKQIFIWIQEVIEEESKIKHLETLAIILTEYNVKHNYHFIQTILDQIEVIHSRINFERNIPKVEFLGNF